MKDKIRVRIYPVGEPAHDDWIDAKDTLTGLQAIVGGLIEPVDLVRFPDGSAVSVYCNEEGLLEGLRPNRIIGLTGGVAREPLVLHGNLVLSRIDASGETVSITDADAARFADFTWV